MHKCAVDRESCISAVRVRGRFRFVGRGHSDQASINGFRAGSISALGACVAERFWAPSDTICSGKERSNTAIYGSQFFYCAGS